MKRTWEEINDKIKRGTVVVVTAEEMTLMAEERGVESAGRRVDVVTTGTFSPMCSSGVLLNTGHHSPRLNYRKAWINGVPAYAGIAAVDLYLGATSQREIGTPGLYGGGHVIEELAGGGTVHLRGEGHGSDCYPGRTVETRMALEDFRDAILLNPRNCYQNYNVAVNRSDRTIYTYMGRLEPNMKNANYCSAGQLSPLLNDPYYETIGVGTRVWLAGAQGHVYAEGTQHAGRCERTEGGAAGRVLGNPEVRREHPAVDGRVLGLGLAGEDEEVAETQVPRDGVDDGPRASRVALVARRASQTVGLRSLFIAQTLVGNGNRIPATGRNPTACWRRARRRMARVSSRCASVISISVSTA